MEKATGIKPGVCPNMPRHDYDAAPATSHSMLQEFRRGETMKTNRRLLIGNAFHKFCELNDYGKYREEFPTTDADFDLRLKDQKEAFAILQERKGKNLLRKSENQLVDNMIFALEHSEIGDQFLKTPGGTELAIFGTLGDSDGDHLLRKHDTLCKGLVDKVTDNYLWDIKTTNCQDEQEFKDSILKFNYDSQFAMYRELYFSATGTYKPCAWLCVCIQPPHNVFIPMQAGRPLPGPYMLNCGLRRLDTLLTFFERYSDDEG